MKEDREGTDRPEDADAPEESGGNASTDGGEGAPAQDGTQPCPKCGAPLAPNVRLCLCGYQRWVMNHPVPDGACPGRGWDIFFLKFAGVLTIVGVVIGTPLFAYGLLKSLAEVGDSMEFLFWAFTVLAALAGLVVKIALVYVFFTVARLRNGEPAA